MFLHSWNVTSQFWRLWITRLFSSSEDIFIPGGNVIMLLHLNDAFLIVCYLLSQSEESGRHKSCPWSVTPTSGRNGIHRCTRWHGSAVSYVNWKKNQFIVKPEQLVFNIVTKTVKQWKWQFCTFHICCIGCLTFRLNRKQNEGIRYQCRSATTTSTSVFISATHGSRAH